MTRWPRGEHDIEQLLTTHRLQRVSGAAANGQPLLDKAARTLDTARAIAATDPDSAYVLAYDAARFAATALLAQQGLRPTTAGGHYAVEQAVRAQFGEGFHSFGSLRRRRNELEYPAVPGDSTTEAEVIDAVQDVQPLLSAASRLLTNLSIFL